MGAHSTDINPQVIYQHLLERESENLLGGSGFQPIKVEFPAV